MKTNFFLLVVVTAGALATFVTTRNPATPPSRTAAVAGVQVVATRQLPPPAAPVASPEPPAPTPVPETQELRELLEHSFVTGSNAHAFMELFAHSDSGFQEFIEYALVNNDQPAGTPNGVSANTGPTPSPTTDPRLQK